MAHFAKLNTNNIVTAVYVINNNVLLDSNDVEQESLGISFCESLYTNGKYIQTSYNGNFRKNYAGIGYSYDSDRDAFIPPQPLGNYILDSDTCLWVIDSA